MGTLAWLVVAAAVAAPLAALLCALVMRFGLKDSPTEARKIQAAPVPTAGGLGFAIAALAVSGAASQLAGIAASPVILAVICGAVAALALGLADDRWTLPAKPKLALMLAFCAGLAASGVRADALAPWPGALLALPVILGSAGSMLWLLVIVNAVNFMDGANGLAMGMAAICALGLAVCFGLAGAFDAALLTSALAGALAGFLVWNAPGRLYAGDTGALFAGAMLGGLSLVLVKLRPDWMLVPPILLLPFLTDVLLTLVWRAQRGKRLFVAHRDHVYQIAMKAGLKHWQVAGVHAVWAVNAAGIGVVAAIMGGHAPLIAFLGLLAASVWVHLRARRSGEAAGLVGANVP